MGYAGAEAVAAAEGGAAADGPGAASENENRTSSSREASGAKVELWLSLVSRKPTSGRLGGGDGGGRANAAAKTKQLGFYDKESPPVESIAREGKTKRAQCLRGPYSFGTGAVLRCTPL